jgi:hypothetical protein
MRPNPDQTYRRLTDDHASLKGTVELAPKHPLPNPTLKGADMKHSSSRLPDNWPLLAFPLSQANLEQCEHRAVLKLNWNFVLCNENRVSGRLFVSKESKRPKQTAKGENWQSQPPSSAPAGFAKDTEKKQVNPRSQSDLPRALSHLENLSP